MRAGFDHRDHLQGREKEVIIITAVRSSSGGGGGGGGGSAGGGGGGESESGHRGSVGFVGSWQRLNVALTRARRGLLVLGDAATLAGGAPHWAAYLDWLRERGLVTDPGAVLGPPPPPAVPQPPPPPPESGAAGEPSGPGDMPADLDWLGLV